MIKRVEEILENEWAMLIEVSSAASWFQTKQAYDFFASLPSVLFPFGCGVYRGNILKGVCIGFVTMENNPVMQFFTRRAIINGGPLLAEDATQEEVTSLMLTIRESLQQMSWKQCPIYIEIRNFNDYSRYKNAFLQAGFAYKEHLNFHVPTMSQEQVLQQMDEGRRRNIRATIKAGATIVENPSSKQVHEFYGILHNLYHQKIRLPLFSLAFFEALREVHNSVFLLVEYKSKIIGGTVCVMLKGKCMYEWYVCGEDGIYEGVYPSSYATYAGLQYAFRNNIPLFDMMGAGVPNKPNGVRDFKARFGGELIEDGRFLSIHYSLLYKIGICGVKLFWRL